MGDFLELCRQRYSLRRFADRPVEREKINQCLEAARLAPSASNGQPWHFVVFDDPQRKAELCRTVFTGIYSISDRFARAPVIVVLLIRRTGVFERIGNAVQGIQLQLLDAGIAGEHFVLAAQALGLGTCWIGWYDPKKLMRFLRIRNRRYRPAALFALGYPPDGIRPPTKQRRPLESMVSWNQMSE